MYRLDVVDVAAYKGPHSAVMQLDRPWQLCLKAACNQQPAEASRLQATPTMVMVMGFQLCHECLQATPIMVMVMASSSVTKAAAISGQHANVCRHSLMVIAMMASDPGTKPCHPASPHGC
jgi:hypothetical protein